MSWRDELPTSWKSELFLLSNLLGIFVGTLIYRSLTEAPHMVPWYNTWVIILIAVPITVGFRLLLNLFSKKQQKQPARAH